MPNLDRFFQDMDSFTESKVDLSSYEPITKKREFLDLGTVVSLNDNSIGEVVVTDRMVKYENKLYDYKGEYTDYSDNKKDIYFDENDIVEVKKKEGLHR